MITRGQIRAQREAHDWLDAATGRQKLLDRTRDGDEVVDFLLAVMRGARFRWPQLHPKETGVLIRPTGEQRLRVALVLAERLWGRPPTAGAEGASVTRRRRWPRSRTRRLPPAGVVQRRGLGAARRCCPPLRRR